MNLTFFKIRGLNETEINHSHLNGGSSVIGSYLPPASCQLPRQFFIFTYLQIPEQKKLFRASNNNNNNMNYMTEKTLLKSTKLPECSSKLQNRKCVNLWRLKRALLAESTVLVIHIFHASSQMLCMNPAKMANKICRQLFADFTRDAMNSEKNSDTFCLLHLTI